LIFNSLFALLGLVWCRDGISKLDFTVHCVLDGKTFKAEWWKNREIDTTGWVGKMSIQSVLVIGIVDLRQLVRELAVCEDGLWRTQRRKRGIVVSSRFDSIIGKSWSKFFA
jgi:hypothetical protein